MTKNTRIALFPLNLVLFPGMILPLHIFEPRYKEMIGECLTLKKEFGVVFLEEGHLHTIGCTAVINKVLKRYEDGRMDILTRGVKRFHLNELNHDRAFLQGDIAEMVDVPESQMLISDERISEACGYLNRIFEITKQAHDEVQPGDLSPDALTFMIATAGGYTLQERQELLHGVDTAERLERILSMKSKVLNRMIADQRLREMINLNGNLTN